MRICYGEQGNVRTLSSLLLLLESSVGSAFGVMERLVRFLLDVAGGGVDVLHEVVEHLAGFLLRGSAAQCVRFRQVKRKCTLLPRGKAAWRRQRRAEREPISRPVVLVDGRASQRLVVCASVSPRLLERFAPCAMLPPDWIDGLPASRVPCEKWNSAPGDPHDLLPYAL